jgi:hypothetical protein
MMNDDDYIISEPMYVSINGLLHVLLLFTFLSALYYVVIAPLGAKSFNNEITGQLKPALQESINALSEEEKKAISIVANKKVDDKLILDTLILKYSAQNKELKNNNKWVKIVNLIVIIILFIGFISIVSLLNWSCKKDTQIGWILVENAVSFLLIGVVEYLFFLNVASKFVPTPPSLLIQTIIQSFNETIIREDFN